MRVSRCVTAAFTNPGVTSWGAAPASFASASPSTWVRKRCLGDRASREFPETRWNRIDPRDARSFDYAQDFAAGSDARITAQLRLRPQSPGSRDPSDFAQHCPGLRARLLRHSELRRVTRALSFSVPHGATLSLPKGSRNGAMHPCGPSIKAARREGIIVCCTPRSGRTRPAAP
jgi:hypothetical protein